MTAPWDTPASPARVGRMQTSASIANIAAAIAGAQAELGEFKKTSTANVTSRRTGQSYSYTYATLADALDAVREAFAKHQLAVMWYVVDQDDVGLTVVTRLVHASGEWLESDVRIPVGASEGGAQAVASAITYGRRYGLMNVAGLAPEDDDGAAAHAAAPRRAPAAQGNGQGNGGGPASEAQVKLLTQLAGKYASPEESDVLEALVKKGISKAKAFEAIDKLLARKAEAEGGEKPTRRAGPRPVKDHENGYPESDVPTYGPGAVDAPNEEAAHA